MIQFGKRFAKYLLLVTRELAGSLAKRGQSADGAMSFLAMLTPFALFRGWGVPRSSETLPEIAPLTTNGGGGVTFARMVKQLAASDVASARRIKGTDLDCFIHRYAGKAAVAVFECDPSAHETGFLEIGCTK